MKISQAETPASCTISIKDPNDPNKRMFISSVYMHNSDDIDKHFFNDVVKMAETNKLGLIICADTNAHSTIWGNKENNPRGDKLENLIIDHNLQIANSVFTPTWSRGDNSSTIDLTLINAFAPKIKSWDILTGTSESDHEILQFVIDSKLVNSSSQTKKTRKKCDYELFATIVKTKLKKQPGCTSGSDKITDHLITPNDTSLKRKKDIDFATNLLTTCLLTAYEEASSTIDIVMKRRYNKWTVEMTNSHHRLIKIRKRISYIRIKKWKHGLAQKQKLYRKGKKKFNKLIRKSKNNDWKSFATNIEKLKDTAKIAKVLETKNTAIGALSNDDGSYTCSPEETLNLISEKLLGNKGNEQVPHPNPNLNQVNTQKANIEQFINKERLHKAVKLLKKKKTPGADNITNEMIIHSIYVIDEDLITIYRSCIIKGHVPKSWQTANSAIIAKPGKSDYSKVKAYRIISLTSSMLKILETLVLWHLQEDLKLEQETSKDQYGFRRGHATDTAVLNLTEKIQKQLRTKHNHALGIFLDIEGAFDNLPHWSIKAALDNTPAKGQLSNWITFMVSNRYIRLKMGNVTTERYIPKGCPQGGVLSPFLWNLVLNGLLKEFEGTNLLQAFADDICALITGKDIKMTFTRATSIVEKINSWCEENGLNISELKTQIVFWTNDSKTKIPDTVKIKSQHIPLSTSVKFLGITIDNKLSWKPHIKNVVEKCIKVIFAVKRAIGKTWGLSPKRLKWIYTTIILPKLTYGCIVWANNLKKADLQQLGKVHHLMSINISRALKSSAQTILDVTLGLDPIDIKLEKTILKRALTLKAENHWLPPNHLTPSVSPTSKETINQKLDNLLRSSLNVPMDKIRATNVLCHNFDTKIEGRNNIIIPCDRSSILVYTDGSKNDAAKTGYGYYIKANGNTISESKPLHSYNTVFQAEVKAIEEAALKLISLKTKDKSIFFFSDSQAAIISLKNQITKSQTVLNGITALNTLGNSNKVMVKWIPGHRDYEGNEIADKLAKKGSTMDPTQFNVTPMPQATLNDILNRHFTSIKLPRWRGSPVSEQTKLLGNILIHAAKNNLTKLSNTLISLKTEQLKILIKAITGKNCLQYHQQIIGRAQTSECSYCTLTEIEKLNLETFGEETALHILCECQSFSKLRQEIYGMTSLSIPQIISGNIKKTVTDMIKFMTKTGVLTRAPIYPESQISPKITKTWKRDIDELQTWPETNNEDQPSAKQRKITEFRIL